MDESKSHRVIDGTARFVVIATMAFLTVVDLFAAQALLPTLVARYGVSPAAMGLAVNACTFGMAAAGLSVALFSRHIDRRAGIRAEPCLAHYSNGPAGAGPKPRRIRDAAGHTGGIYGNGL